MNLFKKRYGNMLRIGLSRTGVTLVRVNGWQRKHGEMLAEWNGTEEECASSEIILDRLVQLLKHQDFAGMHASIILSDSWVRRWIVAPPQNAASLTDCQAAAAARFYTLYGEPLSDWQLSADWNVAEPFLACAIPRPLMNSLQQVANDHRLILVEVVPQFVAAWNLWRREIRMGSWFGVLNDKYLTLAIAGRHGPRVIRDLHTSDEVMQDQCLLPEMLAREALRLNVPAPLELCLYGQLPVRWTLPEARGLRFRYFDERDFDHESTAADIPASPSRLLALTGMRP